MSNAEPFALSTPPPPTTQLNSVEVLFDTHKERLSTVLSTPDIAHYDFLADTWTGRIKTFFSGRGMNHMTRLIMQTGQQYYL